MLLEVFVTPNELSLTRPPSSPHSELVAGSDRVVKNFAQHRFYRRLGAPTKCLETYPGFFHALLYEKDRQRPMAHAREFILQAFRSDIDRTALLKADRGGFTRTEYDLLRSPAPWLKKLNFAA